MQLLCGGHTEEWVAIAREHMCAGAVYRILTLSNPEFCTLILILTSPSLQP